MSSNMGSPPLARGTEFDRLHSRVLLRITPACAGNSIPQHTCPPCKWDHPRLRGEQCFSPGRLAAGIGSPPLARGTANRNQCRRCPRGITPACAGNRRISSPYKRGKKDHPRLRGEQHHGTHIQNMPRGSPPLARGTVLHSARLPPCGGITPACAGNRMPNNFYAAVDGDHPRLRGEQQRIVL